MHVALWSWILMPIVTFKTSQSCFKEYFFCCHNLVFKTIFLVCLNYCQSLIYPGRKKLFKLFKFTRVSLQCIFPYAFCCRRRMLSVIFKWGKVILKFWSVILSFQNWPLKKLSFLIDSISRTTFVLCIACSAVFFYSFYFPLKMLSSNFLSCL